MNSTLQSLIEAERKATVLFQELENRSIIQAGITEKELNLKVYNLAQELYGIKKYWHKRIVRAGENTLLPYQENPPNTEIKEDDILFLDFGPVFEEWEADFGRTYVIGDDPQKKKLASDIESAWHEGKAFYKANYDTITSSELYTFTVELAKKYGWEYGNEHCGHLIGNFPHEKLLGEEIINYIHPDNHTPMSALDKLGSRRYWIYEIHFIDAKSKFGGFFEQMVD